MMSITAHSRAAGDTGAKARLPMLVPSLAALLYPFALKGFNASVTRISDVGAGASALSWLGAAVYLALALAMLAAMFHSRIGRPTVAQLRAKRAAVLAVAAPTLFTFVGVVLYMLHDPVPDTWLWVVCWAIVLALLLLRSDNEAPARVAARVVPVLLRVAHGAAALALVMIFLALHIANHLMFPAGEGTYDVVMKMFRHVYRTDILQLLVVALFLFQIGTGLFFVWRLTAAPCDRFRTFQIASGVYLAFCVLGHMDSVFIFARMYLGSDTGWSFATGRAHRPRQGPVEHPPRAAFLARRIFRPRASRGRGAWGHHGAWRSQGVRRRFMIGGAVVGGIVATVIMLGMCGMRVQFI
jgi:hypothetical protein